jgi:hypothetical protein
VNLLLLVLVLVLVLVLLLLLLLLGRTGACSCSCLSSWQRHYVDPYIYNHCSRLDPISLDKLRAAHCHNKDVCCAADGWQVRRLQATGKRAATAAPSEYAPLLLRNATHQPVMCTTNVLHCAC